MNAQPSSTRRFERPAAVNDLPPGVQDVLAAKRRRLGTALHELATELARERRRNADLERENKRLRDLLGKTTSVSG